MLTIDVVESYIRRTCPASDPIKLQYLLYYSHVWMLVWAGRRLTGEEFQAWQQGPVVPRVWRGEGVATEVQPAGNDKAVIDAVTAFYGAMSTEELAALTRRDAAWLMARRGYAAGEVSPVPIDETCMLRYYGALPADEVPPAPVLDPESSAQQQDMAGLRVLGRWGVALDWLRER